MDGVHDLGGRQGFGPIVVDEKEEPFHSDWEARMWGVVHCAQYPEGFTVDWWRHCRELIEPVDYLTRSYFDQWMQTQAAILVDAGRVTVAELASGRSTSPGFGKKPPLAADGVRKAEKSFGARFDRDTGPKPSFKVGDRVRARDYSTPTHTRLPAYARGRQGTIERYCGNHVLPDENSKGRERAEPLYTVTFDSGMLWPEAKGRRERVNLDLWESYLERP